MQTQIHFRGNSAYWNSFKWGTIFLSQSTFKMVPRGQKNYFFIHSGLGCNLELLIILNEIGIKYIEVPYCGKILKTTTKKWLKQGRRSPYSSDKVDRQLILPLIDLNLDENDSIYALSSDSQLSLFGRI